MSLFLNSQACSFPEFEFCHKTGPDLMNSLVTLNYSFKIITQICWHPSFHMRTGISVALNITSILL